MDKSGAVGVAILLLMSLAVATAPGAGAQAPAGVNVLSEGSGDVMVTVTDGQDVAEPSGRYTAADLTGLTVSEEKTSFTFTFQVASLAEQPSQTIADSSFLTADFRHLDVQYEVLVFRQVGSAGSPSVFDGYLLQFDEGRGDYNWIAQADVLADIPANTVAVTVARELLLDANGAAPFPGRSLEGFWAGSGTILEFIQLDFQVASATPPRIHDRMPNTGNGTVTLPIALGLQQSGNARLYADIPFRSSNGEATTFVFDVDAINLADQDDRFGLSVAGVPANWQVQLPGAAVELGSLGTLNFPVLVTVPFDHKHGQLLSFVLEMTSESDPGSVGRVELGVRYTTVPQPAGHHPKVWLHTRHITEDPVLVALFTAFGRDQVQGYFNAQQEDLTDDEIAYPGDAASFVGDVSGTSPQVRYDWSYDLSPSLELGLDFDLSRTGKLTIPMRCDLPMNGAVLDGVIYYYGPQDGDFRGFGGTPVARIEATAAVDIPQGTVHEFKDVVITPLPAGDLLPFAENAALEMELNLTFTGAGLGFGPGVKPEIGVGGEMELPLLEYHDPVDDVYSSLDLLAVEVQDEQDRLVNPGETVVFQVRIENQAIEAHSVHVNVTGNNAGWARVLGEPHMELEPGQTGTVSIAVTAPEGAVDGDAADLVLQAVSMQNQNLRGLARLLATVTTTEDVDDESGRADALDEGSADTPFVALAPVVLLLAALAVARRR